MMRKLFLATLGISTSLLAITPEQQAELDKIYQEREAKIKSTNISEESKEIAIDFLVKERKEVESLQDEKIQNIINYYKKNGKIPSNFDDVNAGVYQKSDSSWAGWVFGASGAKLSFFYGGNLGSAYMVYGSIGPKYNFTNAGGGASFVRMKGFSLSLPIGFGGINTSGIKNDMDFVLPIALEANYMFSDFMGFGLSAGLRYTYSPQDIGDLHIMDFYAGMDIYYGIYIEAGYVFYSSQDVKVGNRTISTDPLSGAVTLNLGWRF